MDTKALIDVLYWALDTGVTSTDSPSYQLYNDDQQRLWEATRVWAAEGVKKRVIETLRAYHELEILDPGYIVFGELAWIMVSLDQIADWLLGQTLKDQSPVSVVKAFASLLEADEATLLHVYAIAGLTVEAAIRLEPDAELLPFESLSPSYGRGATRQRFVNLLGVPQLPPISLLVISETSHPVFRKTVVNQDGTTGRAPRIKADRHLYERASDIARALVPCGPYAASIVGAWKQYDNPGIPQVMGGAFTHDMEMLHGSDLLAPVVDPASIRRSVSQFIGLPDEFRQEIHVPIDRLNQALRRRTQVDRAIDLGIALEALLLHDLNSDRGELAHRLSLRGAWLLGGNAHDRRLTFEALRNVYDLRSSAVHSGTLGVINRKLRGSNKKTEDALKEGIRLCAALISELIEFGEWPDWNALVLGN